MLAHIQYSVVFLWCADLRIPISDEEASLAFLRSFDPNPAGTSAFVLAEVIDQFSIGVAVAPKIPFVASIIMLYNFSLLVFPISQMQFYFEKSVLSRLSRRVPSLELPLDQANTHPCI